MPCFVSILALKSSQLLPKWRQITSVSAFPMSRFPDVQMSRYREGARRRIAAPPPVILNERHSARVKDPKWAKPHFATPPPNPLLLKTKAQPQFDRPVTDRSNPRFRVISTPNPVISLLASDRCELPFASFLPEQITNITPKSNAIKCECKANYTQNAIPKS